MRDLTDKEDILDALKDLYDVYFADVENLTDMETLALGVLSIILEQNDRVKEGDFSTVFEKIKRATKDTEQVPE